MLSMKKPLQNNRNRHAMHANAMHTNEIMSRAKEAQKK